MAPPIVSNRWAVRPLGPIYTARGCVLFIDLETSEISPQSLREHADDAVAWSAAILRLTRLRGENDDDPAGTSTAAIEAAEFLLQFAQNIRIAAAYAVETEVQHG